MLAKLFNVQSPWFIPLYRRILVVVVALSWAVFEFVRGYPLWAILFGAAGIYCAHQFFVAFNPKTPGGSDEGGNPE